MPSNQSRIKFPTSLIIFAWLLVGTLDIAGACINYYIRTGNNPKIVFQYIASSLFGSEAYSGETSMILLGGLFHYLVALAFTIVFFFVYPRLKLYKINRVLTGFLYGLLIWVVMNLLVLPLTKVSLPKTFDLQQTIIGMLILIVAIGLPLSFIARRIYREPSISNRQ